MRLQNISKKFKTVPGVIPWDFLFSGFNPFYCITQKV
nr:MAG TPA: hypothetical protein [Caudoviricetes sp.]